MSIFGHLIKAGINVDAPGGLIKFDNPINASAGFFAGGAGGDVFYVDGVSGLDSKDGLTPKTALKTLLAAYNKCTAEKHDVVVILEGDTSVAMTAQLDWAKDYTHLVGMAAPVHNVRANMSCTTGLTANQGALKVSASGCIISNIRIWEGNNLATAHAIEVTGSRNYFWNVGIFGKSHATSAAGANASSLFLNGAEENVFDQCTIGIDTVIRTDGGIILIDGDVKRNIIRNCLIQSYCETAAKPMVKIADTTSIDRWLYFKQCLFYNFYVNHGGKLNECFTIPASMQTNDIILDNCAAIGITEWAQNDRGNIWVIGGAPAAGTAGSGSSGIAVQPS